MSNISPIHKSKLQVLLQNKDLSSVLQGLELLTALSENEMDIYDVFDFTRIPQRVIEVEKHLFKYPNKRHIKIWILGILAEYQSTWVLNISFLDLKSHRLSTLPDSFGYLTNLKELDISRNYLSSIPYALSCLTRLEILNFEQNKLSATTYIELDQVFQSLQNTNLYKLNLSRNRLTCIPTSIRFLSKLEILDLSYNRLSFLPQSIGTLTNVKKINLL